MRLEDITVGARVLGIMSEAVEVVAVRWFGTEAMELTYRDSTGGVSSELLYRADESRLKLSGASLPWSFDADADELRLASEAYRISLAYLFDPYLAVHTSDVEPLPHQIAAVYQEMLPRLPLRYILADDPGAGKTIMTGLLIKELMARGSLRRCLIVAPGSLVEQWQDELWRKFHLRFDILTNDTLESAASGNAFSERDLLIARLDKLARNEELQAKLKATDWDLIVCDEAHKLSATIWGGEVKYTRRFQLGRTLSGLTKNFLLLTATPHNGKPADFQLFLSLVDHDRFEGVQRLGGHVDVSDVMRRLVKEELLKFDGTPLFPERLAYTVKYTLSAEEKELYRAVSSYVREEFNRADNLTKERKNTVGFALTILQRRLASSPEAIYQSLRRRCERLERRLKNEEQGTPTAVLPYGEDDFDGEDYCASEQEEAEETVVDAATAAATRRELIAEISTLKELTHMAGKVRLSGTDRKWDELSRLLQDEQLMFSQDGGREKLIIFTEHRDTLNYLVGKISSLLGGAEAIVTIHGGMRRDERHRAEQLFRQDRVVRILIATDAAGEGINLQRAHLMINYDLPWNPNRLEQRFGRIHRIGQTEVCCLWNLVAEETREGFVFTRLFQKLEEERTALGGKVFDILGKITFEDKSLKDLLIEAIRYGSDPAVRAHLTTVVDSTINQDKFRKLLEENALTDDVMDVTTVNAIREDMERREAQKLQPHFIAAFFSEAFRRQGGILRAREKGRYEITRVPAALRSRASTILPRYERVTFDRVYLRIPGGVEAELIAPGHPLLEALISLVREKGAELMKRGTVFIDESDEGERASVLFYIEEAIRDGVALPGGARRVISRHVHFVRLGEDGEAKPAGCAPYLDYRAPSLAEREAALSWAHGEGWLSGGLEERAKRFAIEHLIGEHLAAVRTAREGLIQKTTRAVKERLTTEIQYWDYKAGELKEKEAAGKKNAAMNSLLARRRADDLEGRLYARLGQLEKESLISPAPPLITGGALIIPRGLLRKLMGERTQAPDAEGRRAVELAAMRAVMERERRAGFCPCDVSALKCGYDIESAIPKERRQGHALRLIEVKGRAAGSTTVTVSKNEILTALNKPDAFILALVMVEGEKTQVTYLRRPFKSAPDFNATSVTYDIQSLMRSAAKDREEMP